MSFLPHASNQGLPWYSSMTASAFTHAGAVAFFIYSGAVAFLPEPVEAERREADFSVSLEILDAEVLVEADLIDEDLVIPPDATPLEPDDLSAADQPDTLEALTPDADTLAPTQDDLALSPEDDPDLPDETALTDPEPDAAEMLEPEATEPDLLAPEDADPVLAQADPVLPDVVEQNPDVSDIIEQDLAELQPDVAETPQTQEPDALAVQPIPDPATPPVPDPETPSPLAIDGISPIDDSVVNPLAASGGGMLPELLTQDETALSLSPDVTPEPEVLALLAPEITPQSPLPLSDDLAPETDPVIEAPAPTIPETVAPEAIEPEAALPEPIEPEITEPEATQPDAAEPDTTEPDALKPDSGAETQTANAAPAVRPLNNPTASDIAIGQLLRRIRATPQTQCTLILPRRASGTPGAGISLIGSDLDVLDDLAARITDGLGFEPVQTREEIDPRQCATLDILRQADSYPASRIGLAIDDATLDSGDTLTGRVIGGGGLFVTLLLIDDNGVVQDMTPFVHMEDNTPVFAAPVARSGPIRVTRQILLALGTRDKALDLTARIGNLAQTVFAPIPGDTLQNMVFGVATFDVR